MYFIKKRDIKTAVTIVEKMSKEHDVTNQIKIHKSECYSLQKRQTIQSKQVSCPKNKTFFLKKVMAFLLENFLLGFFRFIWEKRLRLK